MTEQITFNGTPAERALAEQIHEVMRLQGKFFAANAPLRQYLNNIVAHFATRRNEAPDTVRQAVSAALNANGDVFTQEVDGDDVIIITGKRGGYIAAKVDRSHSLGARLYEPTNPLPVDDISVVITTVRPTLPKIEPIYVSDYWLNGGQDSVEGEYTTADEFGGVIADHGEAAPELIGRSVPRRGDMMRINLPQGISIDLAQSTDHIMTLHGEAIISALRATIEKDSYKRIAMFGDFVAVEQDVRSFSKNEIRQIIEYIEDEVQEPVADQDILVNILRVNARAVDFEQQRFALNYRLIKDLEFVGSASINLWSTRKLLDKIGSNKRFKAADMGALFSYLEEGFDDSVTITPVETIQARGYVDHTVTFFECDYGVLPLTKALAAILPSPVINRQTSAVLTVDMPQLSYQFKVNVRYPAANRGGWIQGLDIFRDAFVPGAIIRIAQTDAPNVVTITYNEADERVEKLLFVDDSKKKSKFAFAERSFACDIDEDMLTTVESIGRIRQIKFLELGDRRNVAQLIERVFAAFGEEVGTKHAPAYQLAFEPLYMVITAYRSISRDYLRQTISDMANCALVNNASGTWECRISDEEDNAGDDSEDE